MELVDRGPCPLCGSTERDVHVPLEIPVARCRSCGFLFSARVMPAAQLDRYYADTFGGQRHLRGQRVNAAVTARVLDRLLDLSEVSSLLDVGAGYGLLLDELRRPGLVLRGVELSEEEASHAQAQGLDVTTTAPEEAFDVVVAFETIEHTLDPVAFVRELASHAKPGGSVVIGTDNFESAAVRALGAGFPKWIPHVHVSHFAPASLERCVAQAGLTVVRRASYTSWELLARRLTRRGAAYSLDDSLATEMTRGFRFYRVRKALNPLWTRALLRDDLQGSMMYVLARV